MRNIYAAAIMCFFLSTMCGCLADDARQSSASADPIEEFERLSGNEIQQWSDCIARETLSFCDDLDDPLQIVELAISGCEHHKMAIMDSDPYDDSRTFEMLSIQEKAMRDRNMRLAVEIIGQRKP